MARQASPDSVSTIVSKINVDETVVFDNPYTSVMVMVSLLKKKEGQASKIFKIKYVDNKTSVTRVK
jgi:hypothetical protein